MFLRNVGFFLLEPQGVITRKIESFFVTAVKIIPEDPVRRSYTGNWQFSPRSRNRPVEGRHC
jgi:hypothetical protein